MATANFLEEPHTSKCQHFHHYDFTKDPQFMKGWDTISQSHKVKDKESSLETRMLTAKIFYYSRFVEAITLEEYQAWLAEGKKDDAGDHNQNILPGVEETGMGDTLAEEKDPKSNEEDELVDKIKLVSDSDTETAMVAESVTNKNEACSQDSAPSAEAESQLKHAESQLQDPRYPASFVEVMQRVQAGLDIPGVEELHIEPTNEPATESLAAKAKKPWDALS